MDFAEAEQSGERTGTPNGCDARIGRLVQASAAYVGAELTRPAGRWAGAGAATVAETRVEVTRAAWRAAVGSLHRTLASPPKP